MHRSFTFTLATLCTLALGVTTARASLSSYASVVASGSAITPPTWTSLYTGSTGSRRSSSVTNTATGFTLPFDFVLDGVTYSRISVSTNGLISFGSNNVSSTGSNNLTSTSSTYGQFPRIAAWWDQLYITGGAQWYCGRSPAIRWGVSGTSPNRILVVDFRDMEVASRSVAFSSWQVRFYETSNMIEFHYGSMTSRSCRYSSTYSTFATIGIADASNDYISVTPSYSSAFFRTTSAYNSVNLSNSAHRIPANTIYRFAPCNISLAGDVSQGGSATMMQGDTLLAGASVQRGSAGSFQPFTINGSIAGCGTGYYQMSISGPHAADYRLSSSSGSIAPAGSVTPTLSFTPSGTGPREAILTVTDANGFRRTYPLAGVGRTRVGWIGNLLEGGTPGLAGGDTLMSAIGVRRMSTGTFAPVTITNTNPDPASPPMSVSFAVDSAGQLSTQYSIATTGVTLAPGESYSLPITFDAAGVGGQPARLMVNADGESRAFTLLAVSDAPGIMVTAGDATAGPLDPIFNQVTACAGEHVTSIPFVITNNGTMPLSVNDIAFYLTDTNIQQGTPLFPLMRDDRGGLASLADYRLSDMPGGIPLTATPAVSIPFVVAAGERRAMYLTFVGQLPGKRFARAFVRTNAENVWSQDTSTAITEGLFTTDLLGRAVGSQLAARADGAQLTPVVFAHTSVGDSSEATITLANTGACDLRVSRAGLRIVSGDVNDIRIVSALAGARIDAATGDYVLAPGAVDSIRVRFSPSRSGTRMATLLVRTNDSTLSRPGISERGAYYLDLSGRGLAGLHAEPLALDPVVIGGSVSGVVRLENTLTVPVAIASIGFVDADAAEFSEDPSAPWPARPFVVLPGDRLELAVRLAPVGDVGPRRATLALVTTDGDSIAVPVTGEAGTQTLVVSSTSLFENVTIPVGQVARTTLMISNAGTLPLRVASIAVTGADAASYQLGKMPRMDIDAGGAEYLEVTYAPTAQGQTSADLEITGPDGTVLRVALGGTALKVKGRDPADPTTMAPNTLGTPERLERTAETPVLR